MKPKPPKHLAYCQLKYSACNLIFILLLFMYLKMRQTVQLHHSAGDQSQLRYLTRTPLGWRTGSLWAASSCQSTYRQLLFRWGQHPKEVWSNRCVGHSCSCCCWSVNQPASGDNCHSLPCSCQLVNYSALKQCNGHPHRASCT